MRSLTIAKRVGLGRGVPKIDWRHGLARGLIGAWLPGVMRGHSLVGPQLSNGLDGAGSMGVTPDGPSLKSTTANQSRGLFATAPTEFTSWSGMTIFWRGVLNGAPTASSSLQGVTYSDNDGQPWSSFAIGATSNGWSEMRGEFNNGSGSFQSTSTIDATGQYGKIADFAFAGTVGGNATLYMNAVSQASASMSVLPGFQSSSQIVINQYDNSKSRSANADCNAAYFWNRELTVAELKQLHDDPYCFLIFPGDELFASPHQATTASNNKTLTADAGSYSLTGTAATIRHAWKLPAGAGSYALTGTAAAIKHGYKVPAGAGSYALTGASAGVLHGWKLAAGAGSYALTGTAAGVKHGYKTAADAGSYALTGAAASVLHAWKMIAGAGSYSLAGTDATIIAANQTVLSADAGSYALAGTAASVLHGWKVAAGAGSYALTGTAASVLKGRAVAAETGSYALTGTAASLLWKKLLAAGAGSYELSGSAAAITYSGDTPEVTLDGSGVGRSKAKAVDIDKLYRPYNFDRAQAEIAKALGEVNPATETAPIVLKSFAELAPLKREMETRIVAEVAVIDDEEEAAIMLLLGD